MNSNQWKVVGFLGFTLIAFVILCSEQAYGNPPNIVQEIPVEKGLGKPPEISFLRVLSVGVRAPIEVFIQFDPWKILAFDFSVGSIHDTGIEVETILGGISMGLGARYFFDPIRFSGISFASSLAAGTMLTPGKSNEVDLILALPYIIAGTDVTLKALPFLGLSTEFRWHYTVPAYVLMVGIKVYLF